MCPLAKVQLHTRWFTAWACKICTDADRRDQAQAQAVHDDYWGVHEGGGQLIEAPRKPVPPDCECCFEGAYACAACCAWYPTLSVGDFRLLEPHEVRSCELCAAKQCKAARYRPKFQMCPKCRCYYCSRECQYNDWAAHKLVCV